MAFIKKINLKGIEYEIHASSADKVAWANITGKPSTFSPSSHTHTTSQITNFPTSMPASDVYSWAKASTKPSYSWSEITSKPSTFTPTSHTHTIANITNLQSTLDGKVPTSRTVNGKALSSNISLTASDVGAASSSHTHNYAGSSSAGGAANSLAFSNNNEINFVGNSNTSTVYFNYRDTATGKSSGNTTPITNYIFAIKTTIYKISLSHTIIKSIYIFIIIKFKRLLTK